MIIVGVWFVRALFWRISVLSDQLGAINDRLLEMQQGWPVGYAARTRLDEHLAERQYQREQRERERLAADEE
jgi:hypothetical protein